MKLIDLLSVLDENSETFVEDYSSGTELGHYDGRDSIPVCLNELEVISVSAKENAIHITL